MKREVSIFSFKDGDLTSRFSDFSAMKLFILDANILISLSCADDLRLEPVRRLLEEWKHIRPSGVCCIPDFIMLEAFNAEKREAGSGNVKAFIDEAERSETAFFLQLKTPVRSIRADRRAKFIDYLPKRDRRVILAYYSSGESGTDQALLALSSILRMHGLSIVLVSKDEKMRLTAREMGLRFYPPLKAETRREEKTSNIGETGHLRPASMIPHRRTRLLI